MSHAYDIWFALMAFFGFVMITPAWMYFYNDYSPNALGIEAYWLAGLAMPILILLYLGSWMQAMGG